MNVTDVRTKVTFLVSRQTVCSSKREEEWGKGPAGCPHVGFTCGDLFWSFLKAPPIGSIVPAQSM